MSICISQYLMIILLQQALNLSIYSTQLRFPVEFALTPLVETLGSL